ncbi:MAG: MiaB/RimO family radical SAM methylthiotransferase, partial [Elusimicrobia bacterium]|nr:MiaB/RimO family radical SAM methylthiotransferase [Elusimicrobiota bacterium]
AEGCGEATDPAPSSGGVCETSRFEEADLCVVNTCTVTEEADKEALRLIRRIARRNPAARLVVTGCLASRSPDTILDAAPAATVAGNDAKTVLPAMLGCRTAPEFTGVTGLRDRTRAFVKVQDGCNMTCAYCIIPSVRPRLSCKPWAELEREVRGLIESGTQEVVLCGVRLGRYLVWDGDRRVDFVAMLDRLLCLPGDFRIRLSSLEVTDLTDRLLELLVRWEGRLAPSFHVPLQSGSDEVLKRMERWYSASFYARRAAALRARWPDAGLFADVMVGFPGETDEHFEESFRFVSDIGFSGLHVFRFSRRSGTPAARFKDAVAEPRMLERAQRMRALDRELRRRFAASAVGSVRRVLVEGRGSMLKAEGVSDHFLRVYFREDPGSGLVPARIVSSRDAVALAQRA